MKTISHYCQSCKKPNDIGESNCLNCGTRLMIVTFPNTYRFDESIEPSYYEQFLLEKISLLELRILRMSDQFSKVVDIIENQNQLIGSEVKGIRDAFLNWKNEQSDNVIDIKTEGESVFEKILADYKGERIEFFAKLVADGFKFLTQNEEKQALRLFEQAEKLSTENVALLTFIGKILFNCEKFTEAEKYLEKSCQLLPQNEKNLLLLATIYADKCDIKKAETLLEILKSFEKSKFCLNYIYGFLAVAEKNWDLALASFKKCLNILPKPEIEYLIACVYFQQKRYKSALRYADYACKSDENFADAWFLQGIIESTKKDSETVKNLFAKAMKAKDLNAQCTKFFNKPEQTEFEISLPFRNVINKKEQILTTGSRRLTTLFRSELEKAIL